MVLIRAGSRAGHAHLQLAAAFAAISVQLVAGQLQLLADGFNLYTPAEYRALSLQEAQSAPASKMVHHHVSALEALRLQLRM